MASPVPGSTVPAMKPKPMQDPGTAPPWLRGSGGSPGGQMGAFNSQYGAAGGGSAVQGSAGTPDAAAANGLASLGAMQGAARNATGTGGGGDMAGRMNAFDSARGGAGGQQYGSAATDVATPMVRGMPNTSPPPTPQPPTNGAAGTPWDFASQRNLKGSKTFDFDWDPDNPMFGGDAQGFMANSTLAAGSRGAALKMALRDSSGKELFNNGDGGGGIANLTSGKLAKGRYSLAVDPSDPNAEWHMGTANKRGSSYYDNGGSVSTASAGDGWTPGTDTSGWDRGASAAKWDAGADARFAEQNANNEGYGGAAMNPNTPGGKGLGVNGAPSGNPAGRGAGPVTMPGAGGQHLPGAGSDVDPAIQAAIDAARGGGAGAGPGARAGNVAGGGGAAGAGGAGWDGSLNMDGLNPLDTDFSGAAARGADAAYKGATQFMDQDFGEERQANESRLLAQGLQPGSEAYERAMSRMERGQNQARQGAAFQAQGVGHAQAGDLMLRALQTRQQGVNERFGTTDRRLAGRGQDIGDRNTNRGMDITRDNIGLNATLANRRFGLDEDNQGFRQLMELIASSRGGVNMPNFGPAGTLDVGGAHGIASGNANAAEGRRSADRNTYAQIAGQLLGGYLK